MKTHPSITCDVQDGIARLTLAQARRFNAMSRHMWRALRVQAQRLADDASVRVVVLSGAGGHFCAGGDISEYAHFRFDEASLRTFHEDEVWGALSALLALDVPLIAAISGHCMGAGVELACCADLRIATETAQFGAPIARLGFPMAPRELALLVRELGAHSTRQVLLEAAVLGAPEMLRRGFLTRLVAEPDWAAQVEASAQRIARLAPQAARLNKQTLRALFSAQSPDPLAYPATNSIASEDPWARCLCGAYSYADSAEQREGIAAFLAKRAPVF